MTTNPSKRVLYWGLFVSPYHLDEVGRHTDVMAVTSFSRTSTGKVMVHGHTVDGKGIKQSHHRVSENMFFFMTREAAETTVQLIEATDRKHVRIVEEAMEEWRNAQREHRIEIERIAGTKAIQPSELD